MDWLDDSRGPVGGGHASSGGACYHLSFRSGSRATGACARASFDYITRDGTYADPDRDPAIYVESDHMPSWAVEDPSAYWDAADLHERANGRLYVAADFALPRDLNAEDQIALAHDFASELKAPVSSKSGAARWGQDRERHLLRHGPEQPRKEVPTVATFASRFIDDYAIANRQKPSEIAAKRTILQPNLVETFGVKALDTITTDDVQKLKHRLRDHAPKTVNNVLTVLSVFLKKAVEWDVIDRVPCVIQLVRAPKPSMGFYDFDEYERLLDAAKVLGPTAQLVVLLAGEAGLRCGEMIGLESSDVDLAKRQLCIQCAEWRGHVTAPKGGRLRYVPMTARLAAAVRGYRHLKSHRVLCLDDGSTLTQDHVGEFVRKAGRRAGVAASGAHRLRHTFCSHLAMRGAPARAIQELAGHQDLSTTQRYMHLSPSAVENAIRLLEAPTPQGASHGAWRHTGDEGAANQ